MASSILALRILNSNSPVPYAALPRWPSSSMTWCCCGQPRVLTLATLHVGSSAPGTVARQSRPSLICSPACGSRPGAPEFLIRRLAHGGVKTPRPLGIWPCSPPPELRNSSLGGGFHRPHPHRDQQDHAGNVGRRHHVRSSREAPGLHHRAHGQVPG